MVKISQVGLCLRFGLFCLPTVSLLTLNACGFGEDDRPNVSVGSGERQALTLVKPMALLVSEGTPSDVAIRQRLEQLGYQVEQVGGQQSDPAYASGKDIVYISESVVSTQVLTKFRDVSAPVVTSEPAVCDDMMLTGAGWMTDFGETLDQTSLVMVGAPHALNAGLSGTQSITNSPQKFLWGTPNVQTAQVGAQVVGQPGRAAVFGYQRGSEMVGGFKAPGRRVGFFLGRDTAGALNGTGWVLFDSVIRWAAEDAPDALMVVAENPLLPGDVVLRDRLKSMGFEVSIATDDAVVDRDADGMRIVVISETSLSSLIQDNFRTTTTPVLALEPAVWDDLAMTGSAWESVAGDIGDEEGQTQIRITDDLHPLAGGLTGLVSVVSSGSKFVWGTPTASAYRVATLANSSAHMVAIFGYEKQVHWSAASRHLLEEQAFSLAAPPRLRLLPRAGPCLMLRFAGPRACSLSESLRRERVWYNEARAVSPVFSDTRTSVRSIFESNPA